MKYGFVKIGGKPGSTGFLNQTRIIVLSFLVVILVGAALLMLPFSSVNGINFIDALFIATSATCVTGLSTVDLAGTFTSFGHVVVLLLIQIGGLGFMTLASATFVMLGRRFSLRERLNMRDYLSENDMSVLGRLALNIVRLSFLIEGVGAVLLTVAFCSDFSFGRALWYGVFHSVSAFCNAGLDIVPYKESFEPYISDPFVLIVLSLLIVIGGLGFIVVGDIVSTRRFKKLRMDSKIVLIVSGALLLFGTAIYMICEYNNEATIGGLSFGDKLANAFFLSASTRTAGFASFPLGDLSPVSRSVTIMLMFIGASPGSTGGGIKTTTLFVLLVWIAAHVRQKRSTVIGMRKVGNNVRSKAATIFVLAIVTLTVTQTLLLAFDGGNFTYEQLLFEAVSAYATVGLSMGITGLLSLGSKIIIILVMFMGRVGTYTLLMAATRRKKTQERIQYQEFNIMM